MHSEQERQLVVQSQNHTSLLEGELGGVSSLKRELDGRKRSVWLVLEQ